MVWNTNPYLGASEFFLIESRAVSTEEIGSRPHPETIKRLEGIGASWDGMTSKKIKQIDYRYFDFIICMDDQNENYLKKHATHLLDFQNEKKK